MGKHHSASESIPVQDTSSTHLSGDEAASDQTNSHASNRGSRQRQSRSAMVQLRPRRWTQEEHLKLQSLVDKHGTVRSWTAIAAHLPGRTGKQCRERWLNHLRPNMKKGGWTDREEHILATYHSNIGSKWSKIARALPGRTENAIKNFWNATWRSKVSNRYSSPLAAYINYLKDGHSPEAALSLGITAYETFKDSETWLSRETGGSDRGGKMRAPAAPIRAPANSSGMEWEQPGDVLDLLDDCPRQPPDQDTARLAGVRADIPRKSGQNTGLVETSMMLSSDPCLQAALCALSATTSCTDDADDLMMQDFCPGYSSGSSLVRSEVYGSSTNLSAGLDPEFREAWSAPIYMTVDAGSEPRQADRMRCARGTYSDSASWAVDSDENTQHTILAHSSGYTCEDASVDFDFLSCSHPDSSEGTGTYTYHWDDREHPGCYQGDDSGSWAESPGGKVELLAKHSFPQHTDGAAWGLLPALLPSCEEHAFLSGQCGHHAVASLPGQPQAGSLDYTRKRSSVAALQYLHP